MNHFFGIGEIDRTLLLFSSDATENPCGLRSHYGAFPSELDLSDDDEGSHTVGDRTPKLSEYGKAYVLNMVVSGNLMQWIYIQRTTLGSPG